MLKDSALGTTSRAKEFKLDSSHDITDRLFVVRRAFRVNDSLPGEPVVPSRWLWQRGGWLLDRMTGHISAITLPEFDSYYPVASWYRDYCRLTAASPRWQEVLCGRVPGGVPQTGAEKLLREIVEDNMPDSECSAPTWERRPARVTFEANEDHKLPHSVRGHAGDLVDRDNPEEDEKAFEVGRSEPYGANTLVRPTRASLLVP